VVDAYVTFLCRNDGYLPGALVLAYALRQQTDNDLVCLVTDEISPAARSALRALYTRVIPVDGLRRKSAVTGGRSDREFLPARFQALRLGRDGDLGVTYDKIVLLDADILPLSGYDALFQLDTPAGIPMEFKDQCYSGRDEGSARWSWHLQYERICPHGARIPKGITDRARFDRLNMGVNAGLWVLRPSMGEYRAVLAALRCPEVKTFPWPEMQLATLLWSGRWTSVDIRYASIGGYPCPEALYGTHFAGLKPWAGRSLAHYATFPDFRLWYQVYNSMYWSIPLLRKVPMLRRIWEFSKHHG
jgi:glycogenin glucosyltransferase